MNANRWNYVWLINFLFPIGFLVWNPPPAAYAAGGMLLAAVLLTVLLFRRPKGEYWLALGLLACIAALAFLWHPMCLYLAFLAGEALGRAPLKRIVPVAVIFAVLAVASAAWAGWLAQPALLIALLPPVFGVCAMPFIIRASARYKEMAIRLEAAQSQVERLAQDAERRRIAGELHDTLGHTLTFIALKAELAAKLAHKHPERAAAEMEEVRGTARTALKQMREIVAGMRYIRLSDELGACRALFAAAGIGFEAEGDFSAPPVTSLQETILAMGLREAATNVVRHSGANRCRVTLREEEGRLLLTVEDDGVGLEARRAEAAVSGAGTASGSAGKVVGKGADNDTGKDVGKSADRDAGKGADNGTGKDVGKSADNGTGKDVGKSADRDAGKDASSGAGKDASSGAGKDAGRGPKEGTGRAAMKERLQLIEGELIEARSPLGGASVRFSVPIVLREGEGHFLK